MEPSSFCTICTQNCKQEIVGLLLSLSIHHPHSKIYIFSDTEIKNYIDNLTPKPKLEIIWIVNLDKYSHLNRRAMEQKGIFGNFLENKMNVMKEALTKHSDTLFIDSDTIILDKLYIDYSKDVGLSRQYITDKYVKITGYYNAGLIWTKNIEVVNTWKTLIDYSNHCPEQINMVMLREFSYFEFGENYNLQSWRFELGLEPRNVIESHVNIKDNKLFYKDQPLKFIHTHFNDMRFKLFNSFMVNKMIEAKLYKHVLIIERMVNYKWIIRIPKQPIKGLGHHANDSFRELSVLWGRNPDVKLELIENSIHCWINSSVILYDRPTLEWANPEIKLSKCLLMGNGSHVEHNKLIEKGICVKSCIFWPRRPMIVEKLLKQPRLSYDERTNESIFIGNFENNVQERHRNNLGWENVLSEYHCTKGKQHKFTQEEYLNKLSKSKFGLCLRGYGSKCHREVELMAFGTIPLITADVNVDFYIEPLIENIHYIKVNSPDELKSKISINKEKWIEMSNNCHLWYMRNVHSENSWNTTISSILFD